MELCLLSTNIKVLFFLKHDIGLDNAESWLIRSRVIETFICCLGQWKEDLKFLAQLMSMSMSYLPTKINLLSNWVYTSIILWHGDSLLLLRLTWTVQKVVCFPVEFWDFLKLQDNAMPWTRLVEVTLVMPYPLIPNGRTQLKCPLFATCSSQRYH